MAIESDILDINYYWAIVNQSMFSNANIQRRDL